MDIIEDFSTAEKTLIDIENNLDSSNSYINFSSEDPSSNIEESLPVNSLVSDELLITEDSDLEIISEQPQVNQDRSDPITGENEKEIEDIDHYNTSEILDEIDKLVSSLPLNEVAHDEIIESSISNYSTVIRERFVEVNFDLLAPSDTFNFDISVDQKITLDLFDDNFIEVDLNSSELSSDEAHLVWTGSVDGASYSEVTLVKSLETDLMVGNIRVDDESYQIRFVEEGIHAIREIDPTAFSDGDEHDHSTEANDLVFENDISTEFDTNIEAMADAVDNGSIIDVLVAYTKEAREAEGGTASMNALITLAES